MDLTDWMLRLAVGLPLLLLAVAAHEAGHAWAAWRLGDPTARDQGRVTLLPFAHFHWLGCLALPGLLLALKAPFLLGYGKPTPVDPGRLRNPKAGFSLAALAGPAANLGLALALAAGGALAFRVLGAESPEAAHVLGVALVVNAWLGCVNLLPLPGFDGLKVLYAFLPEEWCWRLQRSDAFFLVLLGTAVLLSAVHPGFRAFFFGLLGLALAPAAALSGRLCLLAGVPLPPL